MYNVDEFKKLYPEMFSSTSPTDIIIGVLFLSLLFIIPYLYIRFMEDRLTSFMGNKLVPFIKFRMGLKIFLMILILSIILISNGITLEDNETIKTSCCDNVQPLKADKNIYNNKNIADAMFIPQYTIRSNVNSDNQINILDTLIVQSVIYHRVNTLKGVFGHNNITFMKTHPCISCHNIERLI
jgi:hypothetical protein